MDTVLESGAREKKILHITQFIWYFTSILEIFLLLRFIFRFLQANPNAGFTQMIYSMTAIFTEPFQYVFPNPVMEGSVFEWSTLLAMLVYWFIAIGMVKLMYIGRPVTHAEAKEKLDQEQV